MDTYEGHEHVIRFRGTVNSDTEPELDFTIKFTVEPTIVGSGNSGFANAIYRHYLNEMINAYFVQFDHDNIVTLTTTYKQYEGEVTRKRHTIQDGVVPDLLP